MLPLALMALGILGYGREQLRQRTAQSISGLLGEAPANNMGPPDEQGGYGFSPGRGLLADPSNPQNQLRFAAGLAQVPGQAREGLGMLQNVFARMQQGDQFAQQLAQQQSQFDRNYAMQFDNAGLQRDLQERQFAAAQAAAQRNAEAQAQQLAISQGHLQLARNADARAAAAAAQKVDALPKPRDGYMWQLGANGQPVQAPIPGTPDYAKVVEADKTLELAQARIGRIRDMLLGKEEDVGNGQRVRVGGMGTEAWGRNAATYSMLRGQVISDMAKLRDLGTLQKSDLENLDDLLPDPSSFKSYFKGNAAMDSAYDELQSMFKSKQSAHRVANPWYIPPPPRGAQVVGGAGGASGQW